LTNKEKRRGKKSEDKRKIISEEGRNWRNNNMKCVEKIIGSQRVWVWGGVLGNTEKSPLHI
jgi:hypothetical protein